MLYAGDAHRLLCGTEETGEKTLSPKKNIRKLDALGVLLKLDGRGSLVDQLARALRAEIRDAEPGSRLPPTRTLAAELGVSRNTVTMAYGELVNEGQIESRFGGGSYVGQRLDRQPQKPVTKPVLKLETASVSLSPILSRFARRLTGFEPSPILERPELRYDFRYGLPVINDFPFAHWTRIVGHRASVSSTSLLGYGHAGGYPPLRLSIAQYLRRARGIVCEPDDVIITNGSQQALDLIARILIDSEDGVVIEEPHFEGAREAFSAAGARLVAVPVDRDGLQVSKLPGATAHCRVVYVTPSHQFPTGAILSSSRREELLAWAREQNAFIVEDDYDAELRYDVRPQAAIKAVDSEDRVIYVGTMSKVLFPSLRIGYIVSPPALTKSFLAAKHVCDRQTPLLLQTSLSDFIAYGHFDRYLVRQKRLCGRKRATFIRAIEDHLGDDVGVQGVSAGIHALLWLNGRPASEVPKLIAAAAQIGVGIYPVAPYFLHAPRRAGLLLGYASMDEPLIAEGIARIAKVLRG
jgi:GntR family transcriptional regulator/MocR family aminotransferase